MKVCIIAFKTLKNGQLLFESERKNDLENVCEEINELCAEEFVSYTLSLEITKLIVINVPEIITSVNAAQSLVSLNT